LALLLMLLIGAALMTVGRGARQTAAARLPMIPRPGAPPSPDVVWHAGATPRQAIDAPPPAAAAAEPETPQPQTEAPAHDDQRA
jgi:hypothetical protein